MHIEMALEWKHPERHPVYSLGYSRSHASFILLLSVPTWSCPHLGLGCPPMTMSRRSRLKSVSLSSSLPLNCLWPQLPSMCPQPFSSTCTVAPAFTCPSPLVWALFSTTCPGPCGQQPGVGSRSLGAAVLGHRSAPEHAGMAWLAKEGAPPTSLLTVPSMRVWGKCGIRY